MKQVFKGFPRGLLRVPCILFSPINNVLYGLKSLTRLQHQIVLESSHSREIQGPWISTLQDRDADDLYTEVKIIKIHEYRIIQEY